MNLTAISHVAASIVADQQWMSIDNSRAATTLHLSPRGRNASGRAMSARLGMIG
jgi:hypothetical protein